MCPHRTQTQLHLQQLVRLIDDIERMHRHDRNVSFPKRSQLRMHSLPSELLIHLGLLVDIVAEIDHFPNQIFGGEQYDFLVVD